MLGLPFSEPTFQPTSLSLLGVCCHLVATGRMSPVDWDSVFGIIWDKALIECLLCVVHHLGIGIEK